jgi:Arc/MetJ-type ribon-helix-helix transcriptional regulator
MPQRRRQKISATISQETQQFLNELVRRGAAANLSEAVDHAVRIARRAKSRARLEEATAKFYDSLSKADWKADNDLGRTMAAASSKVNYDGE